MFQNWPSAQALRGLSHLLDWIKKELLRTSSDTRLQFLEYKSQSFGLINDIALHAARYSGNLLWCWKLGHQDFRAFLYN
jgi:hypothetical protein